MDNHSLGPTADHPAGAGREEAAAASERRVPDGRQTMSEKRDKQVEMLNKALIFAKAYPDYDIYFCVDNETLCDPLDWRYTEQQITKVEVDWRCDDGENGFVSGLDNIREHFEYIHDRKMSEDEAKAVSKMAIMIYTEA
jgi:hypothetical protein